MSPFRIVLAAALAALMIILPAGAARAQGCGAYTDEMAGPGGTYGSPAACSIDQPLPDSGVGVGVAGAPDEPTVAGRDNPDAPPVYSDTATDEGERER